MKERFLRLKKIYMVLLPIAIILGCAVVVKNINNKAQESIVELTSNSSQKISYASVDELIDKENDGDYSLETMLDVLNTIPSYIKEGDVITTNEAEIKKILSNYITNQSYKDSIYSIRLGWYMEDGKELSTYIATDIIDKANVLGVVIEDTETSMEKVKLSETELSFNEIAKLDISINELKDILKDCSLYNYYTKYPLLKESTLPNITFTKEYSNNTINMYSFRTKDSTININTINDKVFLVEEERDNYDDLTIYDYKIINKAQSQFDLTEEEFLNIFKEAKLIGVEKDVDTLLLTNSYLIKDNDNYVYYVSFTDGVVMDFHNHSEEGHTH